MESSLPDEEIASYLQSADGIDNRGSADRIQLILSRIKRQMGIRDISTFALSHFWASLLPLVAAVVALIIPNAVADQSKFQQDFNSSESM